eukprot:TRINITY_DN2233_c3_g1_i1.p1 TRINITY_DN2233_c3_g1~~TRINITY_DN2233_c3_g1_i1.p1  ORF type:complete len:443 (+),score=153.22 TRINITY_DN2233_c3_g1_i1:149-1477(+)
MGEEVGAIVCDLSSKYVKMGYSGEDSPRVVFPSNVGVLDEHSESIQGNGESSSNVEDMDIDSNNNDVGSSSSSSSSQKRERKFYVGTESLAFRRDNMGIESPFKEGLVEDWDIFEQLVSHGLNYRLRIDPKEHPIVMSEPSFNTREKREYLTELMFEKYDVPALFVAKSAVLSSFCSARSTGLVLECDHDLTCAVPVYEGFALTEGIVKSTLSGSTLYNELRYVLENIDPGDGFQINPQYLIKKKEVESGKFEIEELQYPLTHPSYHEYKINEIIEDIGKATFTVSEDPFDPNSNTSIPKIPYEIPDGNIVEVGHHRFQIPECLFRPELLHENPGYTGVHQMIVNSIAKCDIDIRKELYNSILVSGESACYDGFIDRLHSELVLIAQSHRLKIISSNVPVERKHAIWIGGSILGSLGSFHQIWISKKEYEEKGKSIIEKKCP